MASNTTFFTPTDPININTLLALEEDDAQWIFQSATPDTQSDRASGLKKNGDEAAWKPYNSKESITAVYKCFTLTGNLTLPQIGIVASTYHIDAVKLDYDPVGYPTLTVTMHKHVGASTHAEDSCNTFETDIVFPAQFGIPSTLGDNTFAMNAAGVGMRTLSFGLGCTHEDEIGGTGNWLAGENRDGVETLDLEFTGAPDDTDLTIHTTWHKGSDGTPESNTSVNTRKVSLTRHIARSV